MQNFFTRNMAAVIALCLGAFAFAACALTGHLVTSPPTAVSPGTSEVVTGPQLASIDIAKRADFAAQQAVLQTQTDAVATQAVAVQAQVAAATSPADKAAATQAVAALASAQASLTTQLAKLAADQTAWTANVQSTMAEIASKRNTDAQVIQTLGGLATAAATGGGDPATLIAAGISGVLAVLGIGATVDSARKSSHIQTLSTQLANSTPVPPAPAAVVVAVKPVSANPAPSQVTVPAVIGSTQSIL